MKKVFYLIAVFLLALTSCVQENLDVDIKSILPNSDIVAKVKINTETLLRGKYTLAVAVIDPSTNKPSISFGMDSEIGDSKMFKLAEFEIK